MATAVLPFEQQKPRVPSIDAKCDQPDVASLDFHCTLLHKFCFGDMLPNHRYRSGALHRRVGDCWEESPAKRLDDIDRLTLYRTIMSMQYTSR